jgi:hypothetical protein
LPRGLTGQFTTGSVEASSAVVLPLCVEGKFMPISIACSCGKKYRVKETLAGKKIRCADCAELIKVPLPVADNDAEFDVFAVQEPAAGDGDESEPSLPPRTKRRSNTTTRDVTSDQPARQKLLKKGWFESTNGGVLGGVLMILIAVVWFVAGLAAGRIFFYPPILLIIGIVAVIKGLFNRE